jgi:hypothetical protein
MEPKIAFQKLPVFISSDSIPKNKGAMQAIVSLQIVLCEIRWFATHEFGLFDHEFDTQFLNQLGTEVFMPLRTIWS